MKGRNSLHVLLALTILVSVFLRPPGTMLIMQGETITYTLCSGGEIKEVTVGLEGQDDHEKDLSCDFFASQIAALLLSAPNAAGPNGERFYLAVFQSDTFVIACSFWATYASRAPPVLS